ncbi:MAG: transglutaminase family protein, partial [Anaeromyxobacteraceae bacterium]
PGAGWIGLDPTSGLLCGEGHIPLACVARPALAAPIDGTSDVAATDVQFEARVGRLGHEARPTAPFTDGDWELLLAAGDAADASLAAAGLALTTGGEPTFNAREHPEAPEWNGEALGETKWPIALRLAGELRDRLVPGAALLRREGKWYPGESLPRWAIEVVGRADGQPLWPEAAAGPHRADLALAEAVARRIADELHVPQPIAAHEDPWRLVQDEAALPVDVDPLASDLSDPDARRRLARILGGEPGHAAGFALPVAHDGERWRGERWTFRRGHLFLVPGDSPMGMRLPLASLGGPAKRPEPVEPQLPVPDPRREQELQARLKRLRAANEVAPEPVRTALCVEPREGRIFVFLPPLERAEHFLELVSVVDAIRRELGADVQLEGYPPPRSPAVRRLTVAPDPGVVEVNLPPATTAREHAHLLEQVYDAALHAGLHAQKHLLDGRLAGSGGGHHLTLGGPTALESPAVQRPALLASLITFFQHHPSLSYLFSGLFVGPTSQAPRLDEARHDALYEMEISLAEAFRAEAPPPWLGDLLFRDLLVDVTGNTHRAEMSIDKLFDWRTPHGRQGLVELRAFEMPPHPRMAAAQAILVRGIVAALAKEPYRAPLVRWGPELHDRFLLPTWLWRDLEDVLAVLAVRGVALPAAPYHAFLELRCPVAGRISAGGVTLEVRNALEPWPVLGEEPGGGGTTRYVDSSMERVEVRVEGLVPGRHVVTVNGLALPLRATGTAGEAVGGVRFRAWAPAHSLHAHIGIHHPLRFELLDTWSRRSLAACAYHVWHPEGRGFVTPPLTAFEAAARRAQRFTVEGPSPWPVEPGRADPHPDMPYTLDLRRFPIDRPMPRAAEDA